MSAPLIPFEPSRQKPSGSPGTWRDVYRRHPFLCLGAALGAGYILGGGLLTPFTARLLKVGARAFVMPELTDRLQSLTGGDAPKP